MKPSPLQIQLPQISVLMPAYNGGDYIEKSIDSILTQSFHDFELLICDDASNDHTWSLVCKYDDPRIKRFRNPKNQGYLETTNMLFSESKAPYITFQDSDDWSDHRRLEIQLGKLESNHELAMCGTNCKRHYSPTLEISVRYPEKSTELIGALEKGRTSLFCGASIMFRREILDNVGKYNPIFDRIGAEDIDWYIRIMEKYKCENIQNPLYFYRQHYNSFTKTETRASLKSINSTLAYSLHQMRIKKNHYLLKLTREQLENALAEKTGTKTRSIQSKLIYIILSKIDEKPGHILSIARRLVFKLILLTLNTNVATNLISFNRKIDSNKIILKLEKYSKKHKLD